MNRVWYEPISATARLTIKCTGCGSPREVRAAVRDEAAAWTPNGRDAQCATCRGVE